MEQKNSDVSGQIFHTKDMNLVSKYVSRILLNI